MMNFLKESERKLVVSVEIEFLNEDRWELFERHQLLRRADLLFERR
jgi:hypothetical protein